MQQAGVTMVSLGIFSWAMLEPREGEFDFGWLDRVMDVLHAAGVRVDLATATASPPPWLTHRYPEVLPVTKDGVRLSAGSRQQYCPSSPVYRRLAARLASKIAERYAGSSRARACGTSTTSTAAMSATATARRAATRSGRGSRLATARSTRSTRRGARRSGRNAIRSSPRCSRRERCRHSATRGSSWTSTGSAPISCSSSIGPKRRSCGRRRHPSRSPPTSWASSRVPTTGRGPRRWMSSRTTRTPTPPIRSAPPTPR